MNNLEKINLGGVDLEITDVKAREDIDNLATVATTGSYNDLKDKPTIPAPIVVDDQISTSSENPVQNKIVTTVVYQKALDAESYVAELEGQISNVGYSGKYEDLLNKPTIPSKTSQLTNDSGFTTFDGDYNSLSNKPDLATVATSGSYDDLSNKPTIPSAITVDSALSITSTNPVQNKVITNSIDNIINGGPEECYVVCTNSNGKDLKTTFDNIPFDTVSNEELFSIANETLTTNKAGFYAITLKAHDGCAGNSIMNYRVLVNNGLVFGFYGHNMDSVPQQVQTSGGGIVYLSVGDTIKFQIRSNIELTGGLYGKYASNLVTIIRLK